MLPVSHGILLADLSILKNYLLMLRLLDALLTLLHLIIIGFNLTGWIWSRTRRLHLIVAGLTASSWFVLGIWYGMGYCPITDWQWRVKERLGERNLPASFITYYADKISGRHFSDQVINMVTVSLFAIAVAGSLYFNFFKKRAQQERLIK
jgi:hypothetical protein